MEWLGMEPLMVVFVAFASLAMAVLGGIAGIGSAVGMIPVLTFAFGIHTAIPVITVAMLFNNTSRWWANRSYTDYHVALWFALGAVPAGVLGSVIFAGAPAELLARGLGTFLLVLVVYRHLPIGRDAKMTNVRSFTGVGGVQGFLSGLFGGAGPFGAHFYLAYGLRRNAFVGTVGLAAIAMNLAKAGTYTRFALLDTRALVIAGAIGLIMVAGTYLGSALLKHMPDRVFVYLVEAIMVAAGVSLIIQG
ncbi:MAG: sulfite exporter TauE/SafE family protein [Dehalococcoidia bacterium]